MYLSRIKLDLSSRGSLAIAADAYSAHQFVSAAFIDAASARPLFRIEAGTQGVTIIAQSASEPDWARALSQRQARAEIEHKHYERPVMAVGSQFTFRLMANAVRTIKDEHVETRERNGTARKVRVPIIKQDDLYSWLSAQGGKHGFEVNSASIAGKGTITTRRSRSQKDGAIVLAATLFEGSIAVVDGDALWTAIREGLGHGKGFGLGLLSIAPAREYG